MNPFGAVPRLLARACLAGGVLACACLAQASDEGLRAPAGTSAGSGDVIVSPPQSNERKLTPEEMRRAKPMPLPAAKGPPLAPGQHEPVAPSAPAGNTPGAEGPPPK